MKYIFALAQMLTMIWLVALAFPQRDPSNDYSDSITFNNNNEDDQILDLPVLPSSTSRTIMSTTSSANTQETTTNCPCVATAEYNPVCGTNNVTYWNIGRFNCAKNCNPRLEIQLLRACEPYIVQSLSIM